MTPPVDSDAVLVDRVLAADDRRAFAELVLRHQSRIRVLLRRLCAGDHARAEDLAQETFLRAHRRLSSWRGQARFGTWLHRIAWNVFLSDARRPPSPEPAAPEPRPELERVEARLDLERAFGFLRAEERAALALAYGQDLSHEEAAAILGWPLGTLKTHVARGKERLRRILFATTEVSA